MSLIYINDLDTTTTLQDTDKFVIETLTDGTKTVTLADIKNSLEPINTDNSENGSN